MIKVLIKYLLSAYLLVYILLLGGYSPLYAHTYGEDVSYSPAKNSVYQERATISTPQKDESLLIKSVSSGTEKENYKISVLLYENEENEGLASLKKYLKSDYSDFIFPSGIAEYFFSFGNKSIPFNTHLSYTSLYRYLLFGVFRL